MKHRYSAFDTIIITGFVLIMVAMAMAIFIKNIELFEILISLGMWVIISFLILVFVHSAIKGIPRNKIKIPKGLAVLTFSISGVLFFSAWLVGST